MKLFVKILLNTLCVIIFNSCVMDYKRGGYFVKNCTNDTLFMVLTLKDTLTDEIYWNRNPYDTIISDFNDTIATYLNGKKVRFSNYYYVLPYNNSNSIDGIEDTCYLFVIKWNVAKRHSIDEIRNRKMYKLKILTKKELLDYEYEYR